MIVIIVGARPQFIKAAPLVAAIHGAGLPASILHTGQHYDEGMSAVFFEELGIPEPLWNLGCGRGGHGAMTGAMLAGIEPILLKEKPVLAVVVGDTNSTLAGALGAAKLRIPVAHVEAGLRSHNRSMPEELNRVCTDHISDLLFCSSDSAVSQLASEGVTRGVHVTGDIMADVFFRTYGRLSAVPTVENGTLSLKGKALLTLHRQENTENPARLRAVFSALASWGQPVCFPLHPRTAQEVARHSIAVPGNVETIGPLSYHAMMMALFSCSCVVTDSGGLQKEAYWAGRRCITVREETEWTETVASGWNTVTGTDPTRILEALNNHIVPDAHPALYGDGKAAERMAAIIKAYLTSN